MVLAGIWRKNLKGSWGSSPNLSNFPAIRTEGYLYLDRTQYISVLEEAGKQLVFLRPRRFGKSLLLSTLANYYDVKTADQFDTLFGGLELGRNPTPEQNRYHL